MKHRLNTHCSLCDAIVGSKVKPRNGGELHCVTCRRNTAPDAYRCNALTVSGNRCKQWTRERSNYCSQHRNYEVTE
jgi:hypothetical protein